MDNKKLRASRKAWLKKNVPYKMCFWNNFDYSILNNCIYLRKRGRGSNHSVNEAWIMFDTETSKKPKQKDPEHDLHNHVVAWTISIRFLELNIVTLYGHKPSDLTEALLRIHMAMTGDETIFYCHNLPYDYVFLRQFFFRAYGFPDQQLNIKSHYPLYIKFKNGITLKDSLMLAQRKLERWAVDMGVTSKKVGFWDYSKIRSQSEEFTLRELSYIECDTLAGVECLNKMANILKKNVNSMPYTATGIVRNDLYKIAKKNRGHDRLKRQALNMKQYEKAVKVFHGGYTHANRYFIDMNIDDDQIRCYDYSSDYPFCLLAYKYPMEKFTDIGSVSIDYILKYMDDHAFIFRLTMIKPHLKDPKISMPFLQYSKCTDTVNAIVDNGRILAADFISIYTTEISLKLLLKQYAYMDIKITECESALKGYLPRWYTDYIFERYKDKCTLKDGDKVLYSIAKSRLNSIYGCSCMKIKENILEDYASGDYYIEAKDFTELFDKYMNKRSTILNYIWGVYCTEYASVRLFDLAECIDYEVGGEWLYSDTDSIYGTCWNKEKLDAYNESCKDLLRQNNYGAVIYKDKEYWLGIAELDGVYKAMRICGAKRYCCVKWDDSFKLTVAGVPKSGVDCITKLEDFTDNFVFPGSKTGKLTHTYYYVDSIYTDDQGNETGDSIDLTPCDYLLSTIDRYDITDLFNEEVTIQVYE